MIIEIEGEHTERGDGTFRYELVDKEGYAALSATGIAIAVETMLGLAAGPAPQAGLYLPETLVDAEYFVRRLQDLGVSVRG